MGAIGTTNGNARVAALPWASNNFTQVTKDFCRFIYFGGGEWLFFHWFFGFMGNFMEVNKVFDWVTKQLEQQTGTHGTALPWASNNFTHLTKNFCKKNPLPLSFISFIYLLVVLILV